MGQETETAGPAADGEDLQRRLHVVADPQRLRILALLAGGEHGVCEITAALGLPQNAVSHHLQVLRGEGLLDSRRKPQDRRWVYYRLRPEALRPLGRLLLDWADAAETAGERAPACPLPPPF
ncbi:ArsR family transcriptional regulator [Candidatus Hydrogenisulfobacillus filiaventi]|uniref:ArsR family transcriptional regulator n=1 Tax=Candidatus Hydrogenisulfobacillus filiaventi TaxID=2707344 RepID=A0A6F8ZKA1_9FIRM|nr:metalloregulator ArsR/SmtB family transcription factor [Bacillota bacterium]CAB1130032.1 ArsR family transcriptional regulator [Candidatus Hydrogenisulfobacillus filiaventi]